MGRLSSEKKTSRDRFRLVNRHDDVYYFSPPILLFILPEMVIDATSLVDGPSRDPPVTSTGPFNVTRTLFRKKKANPITKMTFKLKAHFNSKSLVKQVNFNEDSK